MSLDAWILEKYEFASRALREMLDDSSELWTQLDRVHGIYCMLSHHCVNRFTHTLFEKVFLLLPGFDVDEFAWRMARSTYSYGRFPRSFFAGYTKHPSFYQNTTILCIDCAIKMSRDIESQL